MFGSIGPRRSANSGSSESSFTESQRLWSTGRKTEAAHSSQSLWIVLLSILAFGLWIFARTTLVGLLLIAYSGITQIFPGLILSLRKRPPNPWSVAIGILV